jgi:hypothetical protein
MPAVIASYTEEIKASRDPITSPAEIIAISANVPRPYATDDDSWLTIFYLSPAWHLYPACQRLWLGPSCQAVPIEELMALVDPPGAGHRTVITVRRYPYNSLCPSLEWPDLVEAWARAVEDMGLAFGDHIVRWRDGRWLSYRGVYRPERGP